MKILLVAATKFELEYIILQSSETKIKNNTFFSLIINDKEIDVLITGVGIYNTTYQLTRFLQSNKYDFILNVGIAGSFNEKINLGTTVEVTEECFGDLVWDDSGFKTLFEYGLLNDDINFKDGVLINEKKYIHTLKNVRGLTINSISHNKDYNLLISKKFDVEIETMEGAAFFFVCINEKTPFMQIRSISNYVGEKDKSKWEFEKAKKDLSDKTINLLKNM